MKAFTTPERNREPIKFELDEREVRFRPPKTAGIIVGMFEDDGDNEVRPAKAAMDWFADGLSDEDEDWIIGRLKDPEDSFDLPDLTEIIKWLVGKATARPTGSRRD